VRRIASTTTATQRWANWRRNGRTDLKVPANDLSRRSLERRYPSYADRGFKSLPLRCSGVCTQARLHRAKPRPLALSPIEAARGRVVDGDLLGREADAPTLQTVCVNRGGTAVGQLAFAVVVYSAGPRAPRVLGVLTPRVNSSGTHVPILIPSAITHDKVVLTEFFLGPHAGGVCARGSRRAARHGRWPLEAVSIGLIHPRFRSEGGLRWQEWR
jgi:hypothetical protein